MTHADAIHDIHQENFFKTILGFWVYLMTDCVLFGCFFAAYAVLHNNTYGGPSGRDIVVLPYVLTQTLFLLTSSFTCGLGMLAGYRFDSRGVFKWFAVTFLLGAAFLGMEFTEFYHLYREGNSWQRSGFLSSFFSLVGTHGAHITAGLLWTIVLMTQIFYRGLTLNTLRRLVCLGLFWHFLDVIWIFIFTFVYLMGAAA